MLVKDFRSSWYTYWARMLKQDEYHLDGHKLKANKFWQNASICQALIERGKLKKGKKGIGFGVGLERLPAVFAEFEVDVMATDQSFHGGSSAHWAERELAKGLSSLNKIKIVSDKKFLQRVQFRTLDMKNIPNKYSDRYDFLWSNCSLGHLGSIPSGLSFIRESLRCLKRGGIAVHTTEVNVLSNNLTVDHGDTVVFRLQDIYHLFQELTKIGYVCSPLKFHLGRSSGDFRLSMQPKFGNDYSKIQIGGHLATQVILIIRRPRYFRVSKYLQKPRLFKLRRHYLKGLKEITDFSQVNPEIAQLLNTQNFPSELDLKPVVKELSLKIQQHTSYMLLLEYINKSQISFYSAYGHLLSAAPLVLGTNKPKDRASQFADSRWIAGSNNRPSSDFMVKNLQGTYEHADHVKPGQDFALRLWLNTHNLKKGHYNENFNVLLEGMGWVEGAEVKVCIEII